MAEKCPVLNQLFSPNQPGSNLVPNERDFLSFFARMKGIGDAHLTAYILILKRFFLSFCPKNYKPSRADIGKGQGVENGLKISQNGRKTLKIEYLNAEAAGRNKTVSRFFYADYSLKP